MKVDIEDFTTTGAVGQGEEHLTIKSAGTAESGIDGVHSVGGSNDDDLPTFVQAVHQSQKGGDNTAVDLILLGGPDRSESIDFVKEDDGGLVGFGLVEE